LVQDTRGLRPVETAIVLRDFARVSDAVRRLRLRREFAASTSALLTPSSFTPVASCQPCASAMAERTPV
jgi:hypothetical protein